MKIPKNSLTPEQRKAIEDMVDAQYAKKQWKTPPTIYRRFAQNDTRKYISTYAAQKPISEQDRIKPIDDIVDTAILLTTTYDNQQAFYRQAVDFLKFITANIECLEINEIVKLTELFTDAFIRDDLLIPPTTPYDTFLLACRDDASFTETKHYTYELTYLNYMLSLTGKGIPKIREQSEYDSSSPEPFALIKQDITQWRDEVLAPVLASIEKAYDDGVPLEDITT